MSVSSMKHRYHYTVEQANGVREWVGEQLALIRGALEKLAESDADDVLEELDGTSGGGFPGRDLARALLELNSAMAALQSKDVVLRDAERGLVDFPAIRSGHEVYLCWQEGEDTVSWWHGSESGFAGRRPL